MMPVIECCVGSRSRCKAGLRPYDILARMGGDEFTALLEVEFPEQAAKVAEKLIERRFRSASRSTGWRWCWGASIGIAIFPIAVPT